MDPPVAVVPEPAVPHAIELFLDEHADRLVRRIWAALDAHGITSLGSRPHCDDHPHVTLSVFERGDPARITDTLRPILATVAGLPLHLAGLGFFLTDEAPAYLGVIPSLRLLTLHRQVHEAIEPLTEGIWPYYRPGALLPHCTLAAGAVDRARVIDVVTAFPTTIPALASAAHLVEVPGGHTRTLLSG
ncbi:2'-5' RNA ligase family protein [Actinoplanes xinjiangensis]|uniref:2'-5' RNA ligase family protein n=1 Tax=Actinoplanes xinjiangensis TaxID=512350 RepID=UPI000D6CF744